MIYGEYARDDHNWDVRDLVINPQNSRGFLVGALKVFHHRPGLQTRLNLEFLNTSSTILDQVRIVQSLYVNTAVVEGHTNRGESLGAASGPGTVAFTLDIGHQREHQSFGLWLRREELAEQVFFEERDNAVARVGDNHRIKLFSGFSHSISWKSFIFQTQIIGIHHMNDAWIADRDFWNWHMSLGVRYTL